MRKQTLRSEGKRKIHKTQNKKQFYLLQNILPHTRPPRIDSPGNVLVMRPTVIDEQDVAHSTSPATITIT